MGRPTTYTPEKAAFICNAIIENKILEPVLKEVGIAWVTLYAWLERNPEFAKLYAHAREIQTQLWEDEIVRVSYQGSDDYGFKETADKDGESARPVFLAEHVNRSRLIVDSLKWLMTKRMPKKYGDRSTTELEIGSRLDDLLTQAAEAHLGK